VLLVFSLISGFHASALLWLITEVKILCVGFGIIMHNFYNKFHKSQSNNSNVGNGRCKLHKFTFPFKKGNEVNSRKIFFLSLCLSVCMNSVHNFYTIFYIYLDLSCHIYMLPTKNSFWTAHNPDKTCKFVLFTVWESQIDVLSFLMNKYFFWWTHKNKLLKKVIS
jgi:hypothetical protein